MPPAWACLRHSQNANLGVHMGSIGTARTSGRGGSGGSLGGDSGGGGSSGRGRARGNGVQVGTHVHSGAGGEEGLVEHARDGGPDIQNQLVRLDDGDDVVHSHAVTRVWMGAEAQDKAVVPTQQHGNTAR